MNEELGMNNEELIHVLLVEDEQTLAMIIKGWCAASAGAMP